MSARTASRRNVVARGLGGLVAAVTAVGAAKAKELDGELLRNAAPIPPTPKEMTTADYKRLERLLIRDIAKNLGIDKEMDEEFGVLEPLPGDEALRAQAPIIMANVFGGRRAS